MKILLWVHRFLHANKDNPMKKIVSFVGMVFVAMALATPAGADIVAFQPTGGEDVYTASWPSNGNGYTVGWSFRSDNAITVTALGFFDKGQDGLGYAHQVGLWAENKTLLGSAIVPVGTAGELVNGFRFSPLSNPIALDAGALYYIGALYLSSYTAGGDSNGLVADNLLYNVSALNPASGIHYVSNHLASQYSLDLLFPDWVSSQYPGIGYFGPNFKIFTTNDPGGGTTHPTPLPAALWFLGSGLAGMAVLKRWIRHR